MEYKKITLSIALFTGTITFGTLGYYFFEHMSFFEAFYMTIITISTVGFGEIKPLSDIGRIITIIVISTGITFGAYTIGNIVRFIIEGELAETLGRKKLEKEITKLKNHYIICGYGRIGSLICTELETYNIDFVVIENDSTGIEQLIKDKYLYIAMDATSEEALIKAGIENAKGIITAVQSDADNVFITLTAKGIRPDIFVLSRASDEKSEIKLKRAGATRVVSPYLIGGKRMAQVIIRPTVVDFIDIAMMDKHLGLVMEETRIMEKSNLAGKNLIESNLRKDFGLIIVAIKKSTGEMIFNPTPQEKLNVNDVLVVLGKKEDLAKMSGKI
ncbi:MAG: potassium channel protein [Spirochaetes bacterium]|nr:potassium channel protein [Spirochaetota bacterium]